MAMKLYQGDDSSTNTISASTTTDVSSNVIMVDGKQQITIVAGQGYSPKVTIAKAWVPTEIKIQGNNAYGCESAVRIPKIDYAKNLDPQWYDIIQVTEQNPWDVINGTCGMGMYSFQIKFN